MTSADGWIDVNGLRLHYLEWGTADHPAMVLLHGTASHAHLWDRFAPSFADAFHIIALDLRGYGDSEWPTDYLEGYRTEYWVSDLKAVIDGLRLAPAVIVGHSGGALHAMHFAASHPDDVSKLIMIEMAPEVRREGVTRVKSSVPRREEFDSLEEGIEYLARPGGRADPALAREHAVHALRTVGDGRVALKGDPSLRRRDWMRPLRTKDENWAAARSVSCPSLVIRGAESRMVTSELGERMRAEMHTCTVAAIQGAGHNVPLHRPAELEAVVRDWLSETDR
jgi:pimeloyl-ACP methyl ester carboxylesterase